MNRRQRLRRLTHDYGGDFDFGVHDHGFGEAHDHSGGRHDLGRGRLRGFGPFIPGRRRVLVGHEYESGWKTTTGDGDHGNLFRIGYDLGSETNTTTDGGGTHS